jgi:hypothetical protein
MSKKSRPADYFTDLTVKTKWNTDSSRIHEHESLFSFDNDSGNYAFLEWWEEAGNFLYETWVEHNLERLSEEYY